MKLEKTVFAKDEYANSFSIFKIGVNRYNSIIKAVYSNFEMISVGIFELCC